MRASTISIHISEQTFFNHTNITIQPKQNTFGTRLSKSYKISSSTMNGGALNEQQNWFQQAQGILSKIPVLCLQTGREVLRDDATWLACANLLLLWGAETFIL